MCLGLGWEAFLFFLTIWDSSLFLNVPELNLPIFIEMSYNPYKFPRGTVLSGPEAIFWINSFKTDFWTFDSLFTFGVITSFAVLKRTSKKQCCNCFLRHLLFLESSADLKTIFSSSTRPWDKPTPHIRLHLKNSSWLLLNLLFCYRHLLFVWNVLMVSWYWFFFL